MQSQITEVGAFEAKTKLAELLRETERGSSFLIVRRGKPVGRLVPVDTPESPTENADRVTAFRDLRSSVTEPIDIRALVDEGRR